MHNVSKGEDNLAYEQIKRLACCFRNGLDVKNVECVREAVGNAYSHLFDEKRNGRVL